MEVIELKDIQEKGLILDTICLGSFDGFHLGHQDLILKAVLNSKGKTAIVLFTDHPSKFIGKPVKELMSFEDKIAFANKLRVDYVLSIKTDEDFFKLSAEDFILNYLKIINPRSVFVGEDFRFGFKGLGTPETLRKYFNTEVVPLKKIEGKKISSTDIRILLEEGKIFEANKLLGYNYEIKGKVEKGLQNGTILGFPTANISLSENCVIPKKGVYVGLTYASGIPYQSIINIGSHPTIDELEKPILETHLLDFSGNLYSKTIYVEFIARLRDEKKFASKDELITQISLDKIEAKKILN